MVKNEVIRNMDSRTVDSQRANEPQGLILKIDDGVKACRSSTEAGTNRKRVAYKGREQ
jgi:hypothetical protein